MNNSDDKHIITTRMRHDIASRDWRKVHQDIPIVIDFRPIVISTIIGLIFVFIFVIGTAMLP